MNNIVERKWKQNSMVNIEDLRGTVFQGEKKAHIFKITGIDASGNKIMLDGTPSGVVLRPDHTDVVLDCEIQDGIVRATLPKACYDVQGRIGISIFLTNSGQITCLYAAIASVNRTSSGTVSPGAATNVLDLVNAISAAVNTIPQSWSGLMADIAPTYSSSAVYAVGAYVYYNGDLYRCKTAITSGETWNSAHWQTAAIGTDLLALKNQVPVIDDTAGAGATTKIWSASKTVGEISKLNVALGRDADYTLGIIDEIESKSFSESYSRAYNIINCTQGAGLNAATKVLSVNIPINTKYTIRIVDPSGCIDGDISYYEMDSEGNRTYIDNLEAGVKKTSIATKNIAGFSLYKSASGIVNSGEVKIYAEYNFQENNNSLEDKIITAQDDIEQLQGDVNIVKAKTFTALAQARLISCLHDMTWIVSTGKQLLTELCNSIGVSGWIDIKPKCSIDSSTGAIDLTAGSNRQASDFVDVHGYSAIKGVIDDSLSNVIWFAVRCYNQNKEFIGNATDSGGSAGTREGNVKRNLLSNTYYVRFLLTPNPETAPTMDLQGVYTGRMLDLYLYDSSDNETVKAYSLTEVEEFEP